MAAPRYPNASGRRGLSIVQCILALSVTAGLMFVAVRVMNGPASWTQIAETGPVMVKTETPPPAPDGAETKTP